MRRIFPLPYLGYREAEVWAKALHREARIFRLSPEYLLGNCYPSILAIKPYGAIFFDSCLHGEPEEMAAIARRLADYGCQYLTVQASGGERMLKAVQQAVRESGRQDCRTKVFAHLQLNRDLTRQGEPELTIFELARLTRLAVECRLDGVIVPTIPLASFSTVEEIAQKKLRLAIRLPVWDCGGLKALPSFQRSLLAANLVLTYWALLPEDIVLAKRLWRRFAFGLKKARAVTS